MQPKIILLVGTLLWVPMVSMAEESKSELDLVKIESMNIQTLIEKAKIASSVERVKIEELIKKKIAKAHRENSIKG